MKDHSYIKFIRQIQQSGHQILCDETRGTIRLKKSGWAVDVSFSYNEAKIYFELGQKFPFRVLDDGLFSAEFIDAIDEKLAAVCSVMSEFEG